MFSSRLFWLGLFLCALGCAERPVSPSIPAQVTLSEPLSGREPSDALSMSETEVAAALREAQGWLASGASASPDEVNFARAARFVEVAWLREPLEERAALALALWDRAAETGSAEVRCESIVASVRFSVLREEIHEARRRLREAQGLDEVSSGCTVRIQRMRETFASLATVETIGPRPTAPPPRLLSIRTYGAEEATSLAIRTVLQFNTEISVNVVRERGALLLQLDGVGITEDIPRTLEIDRAGVHSMQVSSDASQVTLRFRLDASVHYRSFTLADPFRIVIDFEQGQSGGGAARAPVLVLDPGHGADDFGSRAHGLRESELVLDLALRTRDQLQPALPDMRIVLTRETDTFLSLEQRSAIANAVGATAFVSIHLNGADGEIEHGGVTTFVLDTSNRRQALRLAARENGTRTSRVGELSRILAGIDRDTQGQASRRLAEAIHRATLASGRGVLPTLYDRGVRSAMFHVLVGARMPAVLVEASFLTQADEAEALRSPEYRDALARGIAAGIARWLSQRG